MGIFSRTPIVEIEGVIERIGISSHSDMSMHYALLLEGDARRYVAVDHVGGRMTNLNLTMCKPGDAVRFGVRQDTGEVRGFFRNLTMETRSKR